MAEKVKFDIDVETKRAVANTKRLNKEITALGGVAMLELIKAERKAIRTKNQLTKATKKASVVTSRFTQSIALGNLQARAYEKAIGLLSKGIGELGKAVLVAARISALNRVFQFTGKAAGISSIQLNRYKNTLIASGIAEKEALGALQRGVQARFDLNKVVKLGAVAQDAAFVAGVASSDAHIDLMDAILKQRPVLLKQFGILVNLNDVYGKTAKELGKSKDALTATEKRNALYNEVMKQSITIAGAYTEGMKEVGKRLTSLPRHVQAAQNAFGRHFIPVLGLAVDGIEDFLKATTRAFEPAINTITKEINKFVKHREKIAAVGKEAIELGKEYDVLATKKIPLTTEEQGRLNDIMTKFQLIMPGVVSLTDAYGKATEINTGLIKAQVALDHLVMIKKEQEMLTGLARSWEDAVKSRDKAVNQSTRLRRFHQEILNMSREGRKEKVKQIKQEIKTARAAAFATRDVSVQLGFLEEINRLEKKLTAITDILGGSYRTLSIDVKTFNGTVAQSIDNVSRLFPKLEEGSDISIALAQAFTLAGVDGNKLVEDVIAQQAKLAEDIDKKSKKIAESFNNAFDLASEYSHGFVTNAGEDINTLTAEYSRGGKEIVASMSTMLGQGTDETERNAQERAKILLGMDQSTFEVSLIGLTKAEEDKERIMEKFAQKRIKLDKQLAKGLITKPEFDIEKTNLDLQETDALTKNAAKNAQDLSKHYEAAAAAAGRLVGALIRGENAGEALLRIALQLAATLIGGGAGPFGSFVGALFDNPIHDAMLRNKSTTATQDVMKENRRRAGFVAEGQAAAIRSEGGGGGSTVSMGDFNFIVQGNADERTGEIVRTVLRDELPQMIKDGVVQLDTTERLHGR